MTAAPPRVVSRGWRQQLRDGLPSEKATTVVLTVGVVLASAIAARVWGVTATVVVLVATVAWLMWDRQELLDRCDQATDTADRALTTAQAADDGQPSGRHARRQG